MAQGRAPTITTTPAKELTQTRVSSQVQVIAQPVAQNRTGRVPVIHESDSEESDTLQTSNIGARKSVEAKENQELDIESGDEDTADIEMGNERNDDHSAGLHLVDEAPHFMIENGENSMDIVTGSIRRTLPSHDPLNTAEITSENLEFDFRPLSRTPPIQITQRQATRLREELPVVGDNAVTTTKKPTSDIATKKPQWKARTNIVLNAYTSTTRSYTLKKNLQNDDIKRVISLAIKRGALLLLIIPESKGNPKDVNEGRESSMCCLTVTGLKALTLEALVWAAEQHGFEGENDLADHLENRDPAKYINPLIKYVSSHISLERGYLKNFSATILAAFDIDHSFAGIAKAGDLLRQSNYIYPIGRVRQSSMIPFLALIPQISKMANSNICVPSNMKQSHGSSADLFASSIPKRPLELQLPKGMLVMAGCIIHSVLADVGKSKKDDFPPFGLETQWQTFLDILNGLEDSSKLNYHMFAHRLYLRASHSVGLAAHRLTHNEVLNRIDFEAFAQAAPTSDDSGNGNDGDGGDDGDDGGNDGGDNGSNDGGDNGSNDGGDNGASDGYGSGHDSSNTA
ncbi:hypothetical protein C8R41DRAFT_926783 [Lentinula lateritia]|uniref:DUF6532 domain-containing protein n=1 Tax=Lentinula lateritia TaxID=40482 RepID=A0ABQ8V127_9AGAR|nr:hypothetical protein C8R41DRAFT_926783 [Lentinula lateritia]